MMKPIRAIGLLIIMLSISFTIFETILFGNNMTPQSLDELIFDTIGAIMFIFGVWLTIKPIK